MKDLTKALQLLDLMKHSNVKPGLIVYTCLIQSCIRAFDIDTAVKLFREMQQSGIQPDAVTFATLIKGQLKANYFSEALDTAIEMVKIRPKAGPRSDPYAEVYQRIQQSLHYK